MSEAIRIAPLTELPQFERCVELQLAVWGYSDGDLIPKRVFIVASRIGGQVLGAFDGETIVGFAMSFPGIATASRICTRTCWRYCRSSAMRGWGGG